MVKKHRSLVILPLAALILAGLACNFQKGRPEPPATPVPVTTEAVQSLQENLQAALQMQMGKFTDYETYQKALVENITDQEEYEFMKELNGED